MADNAPVINGATMLDSPGASDVPSGRTSVDTMVVGVATGDPGAAYAVGIPGLAASADGGDRAVAAAVATGSFLATASNRVRSNPAAGDAASTAGQSGDATPLVTGGDIFTEWQARNSAGGSVGDPGLSTQSSAGLSAPASASATASSSSTQTVTLAGSGLVFVNTYTSNVSAAYQSAIISAENFYQSKISTAVTLHFTFDTQNGGAGGFVASNNFSVFSNISYTDLRSALASHATSADDAAAVASLPATDPTGGHTFTIPFGLAEALGFVSSTGTGYSDTTYLNSADTYFYDQSSPIAGAYDAVGALEHEISEGGLGRIGGLGLAPNDFWSTLDLFRYSSSGVRDLTGGLDGKNAYFSIDGTTLLTQFHNPLNTVGSNDGGDSGDWQITGDSYGYAVAGQVSPVTPTDVRVLDILGWELGTTVSGPVVSSGQTLTISSGQTSAGVTVLGGGTLIVASGGTASGTIIDGGGIAFVYGAASGSTVNSGGIERVFATANGSTVSSGGLQGVISGGVASGATLTAGGNQYVWSGGVASGTVLSGGTETVMSGGAASGSIVDSGGAQYVYGTAGATIVRTGGIEFVYGAASGSTVNSGGIERVYGTASGDTVGNGGRQAVWSEGTASGATVYAGGDQFVWSGGTARGTELSGGAETVAAGATTSGTIVDSGGMEYVYGSASGGTVSSGGFQVIFSGGAASGPTLWSYGNQYVLSAGAARGTVLSGGAETVSAGGAASGTVVDSGGNADVYGTANATIVNESGAESVYGTASGGTANSGGAQRVYGTASTETVNSGGWQAVRPGGTASGTTVHAGGNQYVWSAGTARGTVLSGGAETVSAGGVASGTIVDSGGTEYVYGTARGGAVNSGGNQIVELGGVASGATINGGVVEVMSGGSIGGAGGTITFVSGGTLQLDASTSFAGAISGFAAPSLLDQLDLRDIAYGSGTTESFKEAGNKTSGTLTVSDGTHSATLKLLGKYVTSQFHLASDGHGGTLVTDPPVVAGGSSQMTFADLAPAQLLTGTADHGNPRDWPAGAAGAATGRVDGASGQTLLAAGGASLLPLTDNGAHNLLPTVSS